MAKHPANGLLGKSLVMKRTSCMAALCQAIWLSCAVSVASGVELTTVVEGLNHPTAVALQPQTGHLFVAESSAGRIMRVVDSKTEPVIIDFPRDTDESEPPVRIGPLGLLFLDQQRLIVGGGGLPDGEELLRVYKIPEPGKEPLPASQTEASFSLPADERSGEGDFFGLTKTSDAVYLTGHTDDAKGWIARLQISDKMKFGEFKRFAPELSGVKAPGGIAISPQGGHVLVAQMGGTLAGKDGRLAFYSMQGEVVLQLGLGLSDVTSLAYSPKGQLYATDLARSNPSDGGLFQLIATLQDGRQGVRAKKIFPLDRPTAMAFSDDGTLFITVLGDPLTESSGKLLKLTF